MANCATNIEQSVVGKLPLSIFTSNLSIKNKILLALKNVCPSEFCTIDRLIRAIICRILRVKGVLDKNDVPILLMLALRTISIPTLDMSASEISNMLAAENRTENLVDLGTAVISQMMTHLPKDISEFVSAELRLEVFKQFIQNLQLKEKFDMVPLDLINSLQSPTSNVAIDKTLYEVLAPSTINQVEQETVILPQDMDHIQFVQGDLSNILPQPTITLPSDMSTYIETNPNIMVGQDTKSGQVQYYYYDKASGTLSDIPVDDNSIPVDPVKLENLLKTTNMSMDSIGSMINQISATGPSKLVNKETPNISHMDNGLTTTTSPVNQSSPSSHKTKLIIGIVVIIIILIILLVGIIYLTKRNLDSSSA